MHSFTSAAILGLAAVGSARPFGGSFGGRGGPSGHEGGHESSHGGSSVTYQSNSFEPSSASAASFPTETANNFVKLLLSNGFPNPSDDAEKQIEQAAHGTLPIAPPSDGSATPPPSDETFTSLRLIAFNELFEVAYFTSLLQNITENVSGYELEDGEFRNFVIDSLVAVQAQEELHTLNANGALKKFGQDPIQPCEYKFPVDNFDDAIALAATFTDVVLGTLQDVQELLGTDGDVGLIRGVGAVIGQEGEQNGFYRVLGNKIPSELPFLTTSTREFAFSALNQNFIVPGTCPNINEIDLPIFGTLNVLTSDIQLEDQDLQFSFDVKSSSSSPSYPSYSNSSSSGSSSYDGYALVYINQQNVPVVEALKDIEVSNGLVTFTAEFPGATLEMNGLTIAAVTNSTGPFASADEVADHTVFGPGLIEIN